MTVNARTPTHGTMGAWAWIRSAQFMWTTLAEPRPCWLTDGNNFPSNL